VSDQPRYYIDSNEDWPVYSLRMIPTLKKGTAVHRHAAGVEIPAEFIERYEKAAAEWQEVQSELGKYEEEQEERFEAYREEHGCKKLRRSDFVGYGRANRCYAFPKDDGTCPFEGEHVD
jgi:hypothetical protein